MISFDKKKIQKKIQKVWNYKKIFWKNFFTI